MSVFSADFSPTHPPGRLFLMSRLPRLTSSITRQEVFLTAAGSYKDPTVFSPPEVGLPPGELPTVVAGSPPARQVAQICWWYTSQLPRTAPKHSRLAGSKHARAWSRSAGSPSLFTEVNKPELSERSSTVHACNAKGKLFGLCRSPCPYSQDAMQTLRSTLESLSS